MKTFTLHRAGSRRGRRCRRRARANEPRSGQAAQTKIEKQLREDAPKLHGKAQKDKTSRAEYEGAAALYDVYLSKFGKADGAYEIEFDLGEIYFYHLDRNADAATHYMAAGAVDNPKGPLTHDAIYNAIAALETRSR